MTAISALFRNIDAAVIRIAASSTQDAGVDWPNRRDAAGIRDWVAAVWEQDGLAEAVWSASPDFAARVEAVCGGQRLDADRGWRIALALARYLVRAHRRATPFGLFAGVAALRFGAVTQVSSAGRPAIRVRPDAAWLASVIAGLEAGPCVRRRLLVQANNLAVVRGERIVVLSRPHVSLPVEGVVAVRNTAAVRLAVSLAAEPVPWAELTGKVAAEFPQFGDQSADALVAELVSHGVLVSSLRPPSTCTDPLRHALDQLRAIEDGELGDVAAELDSLQAALGAAAGRAPDLHSLAGRMRGLAAASQPLAMDRALPDRVVLPQQVAAEAVAAVDVLRRLTPDPAGRPEWRAYRARFVDRYGMGTVVPLADLVSPRTGLGYPDHFAAADERVAFSGRDERLLALAQHALADGVREVVLDDASVEAIAGPETAAMGHVSPHLDITAEVHAVSVDALAQGRFTIAVTGMGRSAMATSGRFLRSLPGADRERMCAKFRRLPAAVEGALLAQLSFPPPNLRAQNVLTCGQVLPGLISLGEHRTATEQVVVVNDLGVAAGRDRLVLVSLSRRRVVEPTVAHAAALHTVPLLGRFLLELPRSADARIKPFDWGAASCLPFRPALRYGRILLAAARWRIDPACLPGPDASDRDWLTAFDALRERLRLPQWVQAGSRDQRLRLNLGEAMDLALLRAHLDASHGGPITVVEAASPTDFGWLSGRAHEIVVPVASTIAPAPVPAAVTARQAWPPPAPARPVMPGSGRLVSASLSVDPSTMDLLLVRGLPALLADWDAPPLLWFVRMHHPVPHLRLRLHVGDYGQAATRIGRWAAALRQQGLAGDLSLDTYHPESGRYGDGPALAAAEKLFAADSAAALAQLTAQADGRFRSQALTAASMVDLAAAMLGGRSAGCEWLIGHQHLAGRSQASREVLRDAVALHPTVLPGPVLQAWRDRSRAAAEYAGALAAAGGPLSAGSVLTSLLHLHHARASGLDEAAEQVTFRLARNIALAAVRRRVRTTGATQ